MNKQRLGAPMLRRIDNHQYYLIFLLLSLTILMCGCGYKSKSDMLGHINSITISPTTNETSEYGLEDDLTDAIKREFSRTAQWSEGGDSLFNAIIRRYDIEPISLDPSNRPEEYRLIIGLSFVFEDLKRNKVIRNERNYEKTYDFYVVSDRGKPPETLKEARENLIRETARDIVSSIVEEW